MLAAGLRVALGGHGHVVLRRLLGISARDPRGLGASEETGCVVEAHQGVGGRLAAAADDEGRLRRVGDVPAARILLGREQIVGDPRQVRVDVTADHVAQQRAQVLLELAHDQLGRLDTDRRHVGGVHVAAHHHLLEPECLLDAVADGLLIGRLRAKRRQPPRDRPVRALTVVQERTQGKQMVGESLEGNRVLAAELESRQRPGHRSALCRSRAKQVEELGELGPLLLLEPVAPTARSSGEAERNRLPRPFVRPPPRGGAERGGAGLQQPQRGEHLPEADPRRRQGRRLRGRGLDHERDQGIRLLVVATGGPDGLGGSVEQIAAHERHAGSELPALLAQPHPDQGRDHRVDRGVLVHDRLELAIRAIEAGALELESARLLPEAAHERDQRGVGAVVLERGHVAGAEHAQIGGRPLDAGQRGGGRRIRLQRPQLAEALAHELPGQGRVAVEDRARSGRLGDLVGDLAPRRQHRPEAVGGLAREQSKLVVKRSVSHGRFSSPSGRSLLRPPGVVLRGLRNRRTCSGRSGRAG